MDEPDPIKHMLMDYYRSKIDKTIAETRKTLEEIKREREQVEKECAEIEEAIKNMKFYLYQ